MTLTILINDDLSCLVSDGERECAIPDFNPETGAKWGSEDDVRAFAERVSNDPRYMTPKAPAPAKRTVVTPVEYFGLFSPLEEYAIRDAAKGDSDDAKILSIFLSRLDHPSLTSVDLASPQVQAGLGLLVKMGKIDNDRKAAISAGV